MRYLLCAGVAVGICLGSAPASGEPEAPRAVSPGSAVTAERLGTSCPTFSWAAAPEAVGHDLVIYRLTDGGELKAMDEVELPAGATSWTPSAALCPEPDGRYAWTVRGRYEEGPGPWSEALVFETAGRPSDDEVRRALRVLQRYREMISEREGAPADETAARGPRASTQEFKTEHLRPGLEVIRRDLRRRAVEAEASSSPSPQAVAPPASLSLSIDGDFDLGGYIFKDGAPLIHTDGGAGYANTAMGLNALISATPGYPSIANGAYNSAFGYGAMRNTTSGYFGTAIGYQALYANTTGIFNHASGARALYLNTTGSLNTACGALTLVSNTDGERNTACGAEALFSNTGSRNTAVGARSMRNTTTGSFNTVIGANAANSNAEGSHNTAAGYRAMISNTTGSYNSAFGDWAGRYWTTGDHNIALGYGAFGAAGEAGTIRIGGGNLQSRTFIEGIHGAALAGSNEQSVCVDDQDQLGPCSPSSLRFKRAVRPMGDTVGLVTSLRPVTFEFESESEPGRDQARHYGLIAEEVAQILPTLVSYDEEGRPYTVRYSLLTPLLLNEVQRQHLQLRRQEAALSAQQEEIEALRASVAGLEKRWRKRFRSP